jgi:proton-translocating NADH-quinone oxidoreductase chain N
MDFTLDFDWIACVSEIYILVVINILVIYSVIYASSPSHHYPILLKNLTWLSVLILIISLLLNSSNPLIGCLIFNNLLIIDSFGIVIKSIVLLATICVLLVVLTYNKTESLNSVEYLLLMVLSCTGMLLLISSYDLIVVYLAVEFQSFCLYILATLKRTSEFSTEAGLKYFILGAFSSGLVLFGCSLIYGFTGTTNFQQLFKIFSVFSELSTSLYHENVILTGILFILVGLLFKLSAVPFHMWAPDVYEGSPTSITTFFAVVPKVSILVIFARFILYVSYIFLLPWQQILVISSISSMVIGTFGAIFQTKIKRLLAYSAIGHVGYMLIGLSCSSIDGITATFFYVIIYLIMTLGTFVVLLSVRSYRYLNKFKFLNDLLGLAYSNTLLSVSFSILLFSMSGVPPLAGFFSKMFIFVSAVNLGMFSLAIFGVLMSVSASFYYVRIIKIMCFEAPNNSFLVCEIDREKSLLLGISFIFLCTFFFWPSSFIVSLHNAVFLLCV